MAGERMPPSLDANQSSLSETPGSIQTHDEEKRTADGGSGSTLNAKGGHTGKGGKLRLSRPALLRKKPYDRPVHPGGFGISSSIDGRTTSLPSRLVDSASNLIVSSASYLFETFFKRRQTLWIDNGTQSTVRMNSADKEHKECLKPPSKNLDEVTVPAVQGPAVEGWQEKAEGEDSDLAKVEGILKQKSLSREEVKRLTDVLRNQSSGGFVTPEAYRREEKVLWVAAELNPVQLAKAYMGEHTATRFVSTPSRRESIPYRYGEGAGPSSINRTRENVYGLSRSKASKSGLTSAERMLKRRLIADDDDIVTSKGPTRRVRQKMTVVPNSSPYIRQLNAGRGVGASRVPFVQRNEKAAEVPEVPKLPARGIFVEEPVVVAACNVDDSAEALKARENVSKNESLVLPSTSSEINKSSCTAAVEDVEPVVPTIAKDAPGIVSAVSSAASLPQLPAVPEKSKGFHMSAFFEDSSSDEESDFAVKTSSYTEAQQPVGSLSSLGAPEGNIQKQSHARILSDGPFSNDPESTGKALSTLSSQAVNTSELSNVNFSSSPATSSPAMQSSESLLLSNAKPPPLVSSSPSPSLKEFLPFTPSASARAPSSVIVSMPPIPASSTEVTTLLATSMPFSAQGAALPSSSLVEVEKPTLTQNEAAAEAVEGAKSGLFSPVTVSISGKTLVTETPSLVAPSFTPPVAAPSGPPGALSTMAASVSSVGSETSSAGMPANVPVMFQANTGGAAQVDTTAALGSLIKAGTGVTFTSGGSPSADRQAEGDNMATDPMTEEPDSSFVSSSASPFLFGSASTAPTFAPLGQVPPFGSTASSATFFSFPAPSLASSGLSSSSAQFSFSSQSSNAGGQLFTFGSSASQPSNPFSVNAQSSFSFGSSAAPSTSSIFPATSSAPVTFPALPAMPSFQFGASSSTSSTSMFGSPMTDAAGAFAAPASQSNGSAFVFAAPPTSSGTPSPSPFQFGGAGASGSPFGGQTFSFGGGMPAQAASNPFAQSGTSNAAPFQFGASAPTPSQSVFPSGNTTPSSLSFGAEQPAGSAFPFTFGAQPGAQPTGQPFSFGGQPAAPVQNAFSFSGATVPNTFPSADASGMDFGGGFSLGAAGGEKTGRKFIKAKRIGGGKRGK